MSKNDEYLKIINEIDNSNSSQIIGRLETLRINRYVFVKNYQELETILKRVNDPEFMLNLWDLRNREKLNLVINEITRLVHNFLTSAKSLVDLTRNIVNEWYKNTEFINEYQKQVNTRFRNNPQSGFIEELRNFSLHYSLPIVNATLSVNGINNGKVTEMKFSFVLIKRSLLFWSGWTQKGKPFLEKMDDETDISILLLDYFKEIMDFHQWIDSRIREIHSKEINWISKKQKELMDLMDDEEKQARGLL